MTPLPEDLLDELRFLAAREVFRGVPADEMVELADAILNRGFYDDDLLAVIDARPVTSAEVAPPFETFCRRVGVWFEDRDKAAIFLIQQGIRRIADANLNPVEEFWEIACGVEWHFTEVYGPALGDDEASAKELQHLAYEVDCFPEHVDSDTDDGKKLEEELVALKDEMRSVASRMVAKWDGKAE